MYVHIKEPSPVHQVGISICMYVCVNYGHIITWLNAIYFKWATTSLRFC